MLNVYFAVKIQYNTDFTKLIKRNIYVLKVIFMDLHVFLVKHLTFYCLLYTIIVKKINFHFRLLVTNFHSDWEVITEKLRK